MPCQPDKSVRASYPKRDGSVRRGIMASISRKRAWPAVRHDQRKRMMALAARVHEVNADTVDRCLVVVQPIEPGLLVFPVEVLDPVLDQPPEVSKVRTAGPVACRHGIGPARACKPQAQVVDRVLIDVDGVALQFH